MSHEQVLTEEGSHYEVSLTAGQAFVAFVLLLLSLAASFAFGLLIGKGQGDDRLTARQNAGIVNEAVAAPGPRSAELAPPPAHRRTGSAAASEESQPPIIQESSDPSPLENPAPQQARGARAGDPASDRSAATRVASPTDFQQSPARTPAEHHAAASAATGKPSAPSVAPKPGAAVPSVPYYAQLMSTSDQKAAEALAAKLIDNGFTGAYVERGQGPKGAAFRVRVKFPSEVSARAAVDGLKPFSKEVWVTKQP